MNPDPLDPLAPPPAPHPLAPPPEPGSAPVPPNPDGVMVTAEDLAELRALRAERAARREAEERERAEALARLTPPTHWVHLADGTTMQGSQIGTHDSTGDGSGSPRGDKPLVPVAGCYPIG